MDFLKQHSKPFANANFMEIGHERIDDCTRPRFHLIETDNDGNILFHVAGERHLRTARVRVFLQDNGGIEQFSPRAAMEIGQRTMQGAS